MIHEEVPGLPETDALTKISEITDENETWKISQSNTIKQTIAKTKQCQSEIESNHASIRDTNHQIEKWQGLVDIEVEKYGAVKKVYLERTRIKMEETSRKENLENEIISLKNQFENMKCNRREMMEELILSRPIKLYYIY